MHGVEDDVAMTRRSIRRLAPRAVATLTGAVLVGSLIVTPAFAATTVGAIFTPTLSCGAGYTYVQTPSPAGASYTTGTGVITSWQFQADATPPTIKFKAFRPTGGTSYKVVGSSTAVVPAANTISTFPARIPVAVGDIIGLSLLTPGICAKDGQLAYVAGDSAVGSDLVYAVGSGTLDVVAVVEPDGDADGYGDETQDGCPTQSTQTGACDRTAPATKFTAGPTRTSKQTVKFKFTADDAAATFECKLKGKSVNSIQLKSFQPCTSPKKFKHLKLGTYTVFVRATDVEGNLEPTPAKQKFHIVAKA